MNIIRFTEAESYEPEKNWKRLCLCNQKDISLEYFVKPPFHASPLHHHPQSQILLVLQGKLTIKIEDEGEETLDEKDTVYIPGNQPHIIQNPLNKPSIGLDIFVPGRSFDFWLKQKENKEQINPL